jgi:hypothetical protein
MSSNPASCIGLGIKFDLANAEYGSYFLCHQVSCAKKVQNKINLYNLHTEKRLQLLLMQ